ncbi:MAG: response regulator [Lachnospira sp.]|nr:response regulator [Lachnospira sp.]
MVKKVKDFIHHLLFSEELEIWHKLLNLILLTLLLGGSLSLIVCLIVGTNAIGNAVLATMLLVIVFFLWMANIINLPTQATIGTAIFINAVCMPMMYMYNGGLHSGMPIWQMLALLLVWLVLRGKTAIIMFVLSFLMEMGCVVFEIMYPQYIVKLESDTLVAIDIAQSIFFATCIIGSVFKYSNYIYGKQRAQLLQRDKELQAAVDEAKCANQAKSDFLANMSHEIRTPINAVLGMDEMILRECQDETIRGYASNIKNAGHTLLSLINDILDFSKIESGKMEIIPSEYSVMSLLNDCYNLISTRAKNKDLEVIFKNDESVPSRLYGDEVRVRQIIVNLLTNAVKYTDKGTVTMEVTWERSGYADILFCVSVKDTGKGIKEESLKVLFDSFKRIEEKSNRDIEGTGLGLTITKQLLDYMGGTINVTSKYGVGSEFTVAIPQTIVSEKPLGNFSSKIASHVKSGKDYKETFQAPDAEILVVDDVPMNLEVFKALLKTTKVNIDTAASGKQCLKMLESKKYHMIFMDHMMPEMDGVETLNRIRQLENNPNSGIPVIALTANAIVGAEEEYLSLGFVDYVSKPVRGKVLEKVVVRFLPDELVKDAKEESVAAKKDEKTLLERLDFLDIKAGIAYCGHSEELYQEIVNTYVTGACDKQLDELYKAKDWEQYRIQIHALKSTSKTIGAQMLSDQAFHLETAAKQRDVDYIERKHEKMMTSYKELLSKINEALGGA